MNIDKCRSVCSRVWKSLNLSRECRHKFLLGCSDAVRHCPYRTDVGVGVGFIKIHRRLLHGHRSDKTAISTTYIGICVRYKTARFFIRRYLVNSSNMYNGVGDSLKQRYASGRADKRTENIDSLCYRDTLQKHSQACMIQFTNWYVRCFVT
jgi:hypothetical protein